jgi:hypothetical protein
VVRVVRLDAAVPYPVLFGKIGKQGCAGEGGDGGDVGPEGTAEDCGMIRDVYVRAVQEYEVSYASLRFEFLFEGFEFRDGELEWVCGYRGRSRL